MVFDGTITLGNILTIVGLFCSAAGMYSAVAVRLASLTIRIEALELAVKNQQETNQSIASLQTDVAVIRERIERFTRS